MIGQENIQNAKIIEDKIIFICNPETDLEPLMVRYGAILKKNLNETIIAVDINFILKSRTSENSFILILIAIIFSACVDSKQELNFEKPEVQIPKKHLNLEK